MLLSDIRKKLAEVIVAARPDLNDYAAVPSKPQVPAVVVAPAAEPTARFDLSMGLDNARWFFDLILLVQYTEAADGQALLDELIEPQVEGSVVSVLRRNPTLNGSVDDCSILDIRNYGASYQAANVDHIGCTVRVEVLTC